MLLKCCFTSTETVVLLGTGNQDGHLDFHTAPEFSVRTYVSACARVCVRACVRARARDKMSVSLCLCRPSGLLRDGTPGIIHYYNERRWGQDSRRPGKCCCTGPAWLGWCCRSLRTNSQWVSQLRCDLGKRNKTSVSRE